MTIKHAYVLLGAAYVAVASTIAFDSIAGNYGDKAEHDRANRGGGDYGHTYDLCGTECGNAVEFVGPGPVKDSGKRGSDRSGGGSGPSGSQNGGTTNGPGGMRGGGV
jgi:hypothetical protein